MMKYFLLMFNGIFFGIVLTKSEVISWYRIHEMFLFDSFHMYGVLMSAVVIGAVLVKILRRNKVKDIDGNKIQLKEKAFNFRSNLLGGIIFGFGWALTGACPGPMYVLLGNGFTVFIVVIASAILGTFSYGLLQPKLPH